MKSDNLIGTKFGKLEILKIIKAKRTLAECLCDCGIVKVIQLYHVTSGNTTSCGCLRRPNVVNKTFGKLLVIDIVPHHYKNGVRVESKVKCRCICGNIKLYILHNLKIGNTISCGCESIRKTKERSTTHGLSSNLLYRLWRGINNRCNNPNVDGYEWYGARGIKNFWEDDVVSFVNYINQNLGPKPTMKHTLDRIDNDKNYEPGNLRWATYKEQACNKTHAYQRHIESLKREICQLKYDNERLRCDEKN